MIAADWIREHVEPAGEPELTHERPWASVWRVPTTNGPVWFKACAPVQAFEPRLTAGLAQRHPDLLPEVIAHDDERAWLLLGDAGGAFGIDGMTLDAYLELLPRYAELQRAETAHADVHLAGGVPDMRLARLPAQLAELDAFQPVLPRLRELCAELAALGIADTIQHDDLHGNNLYPQPAGTRILDWGDSSIAHPFFTLIQAFRHTPRPWHARMIAAFVEPWAVPAEAGELGVRVGWCAYAVSLRRERAVHRPEAHAAFDRTYDDVVSEALAAL